MVGARVSSMDAYSSSLVFSRVNCYLAIKPLYFSSEERHRQKGPSHDKKKNVNNREWPSSFSYLVETADGSDVQRRWPVVARSRVDIRASY